MFLTFALLVFSTSILVFFTDEFVRFFDKIFAIKGAKLFLPLFLASYLFYNFDYFFLWLSYCGRDFLANIVEFFLRFMPVSVVTLPTILIVLITLISLLPVFLMDQFIRRKHPMGYQYPYLTSTVLLLITSALLIVL